jgi:aspartyl-tRNA(Asn)/glutamyl-tRNA(Gln) amidotransferase subunit A
MSAPLIESSAVASGPRTSSIEQLSALVASGALTAEQLVAEHLQLIAQVDPDVRALVQVGAEQALDDARAVDAARHRGEPLGVLAGVPFVVKDNIDVRGQTTSCGSRGHDGRPARHDAPVVDRLRAAGAILVGRANMDELAMGASTQTSAFGATRNPWDLGRSPGGSSGGSAAAVAAALAAFALGTDTGGSIREPAAQCGVVGLAPSPGLVPVDRVVPFAPDLDRVGPLTRSVSDAALVLAVSAGRPALARPRLRQLRVGVVAELSGAPNAAAVLARLEAVVDAIRALGLDIRTVSIPDAGRALDTYMQITSAACVPFLDSFVRTGQAGDEVMRRWTIGRRLLGPDADLLDAARQHRQRLAAQAAEALVQCDVLLSPTMPTTAPLLTERTADDLADPLAAPYTDCWTVVANLCGLASLSLPAGRSAADGLPVGVMLSARKGADADLLALGIALEQATSRAGSGDI